MNREEAIKATKNGAIAACVSGGATIVVVAIAILINDNDKLKIWNDYSNLIDVFLIFGCAYGIHYKKSRFAAVLLFLYFIIARIFMGIETGRPTGALIGLVFLYFYGKAIQGAFTFHKIEKVENPNYKSSSKLAIFAGISTILLILVASGIGLMSMTGMMPSTVVQSGVEMSQKDKDTLLSSNVIFVDDEVLYFFSEGFVSILEGGQVLTDDRVIAYQNDENQELQIYEIYYDDIASVELVQAGDALNFSVYQINSYDPNVWLRIYLSTEEGGDKVFIETLLSKIRKKSTT
jgi:hypothetical protein